MQAELRLPTPSGNTGVQVPGPASCVVDWCSITFPDELGAGFVCGLLGLPDEWEVAPGGWRNYSESVRNGHVRVGWGSQPGVHVEISGKGCRELEDVPFFDWQAVLRDWFEYGAKPTRLDIAFDDREGVLNLDEIERKVASREFTGRAKSASTYRGLLAEGGAPMGHTVYLGSRKSDCFLRFYDKASEQGVDGPWVRVEVQARDDRARGLLVAYVEGGPAAVAGILRGYCDFRVPNTASRVERQEVCSWWLAFVAMAAKAQMVVSPVVASIATVERWIDKTVGPSLAMLAQAYQGSWEFLVPLMENGARRLSKRQKRLIEEWRVGPPKPKLQFRHAVLEGY